MRLPINKLRMKTKARAAAAEITDALALVN